MAVDTAQDKIKVDLLTSPGWLGAKATGSFGQVEGWLQYKAGTDTPEDFRSSPGAAGAIMCGKDTEGKLLIF
jgi:hypothetical protein